MQILKYIFIGLLIFLTCGCGGKKKQGEFRYFRNYQRTFNDLNDKHLKAARQWGVPVSYTHLDVYKRQDILYSLVPTWIPTLKEREDNYARYSKRNRVPLYLYGACLLYTSRFV